MYLLVIFFFHFVTHIIYADYLFILFTLKWISFPFPMFSGVPGTNVEINSLLVLYIANIFFVTLLNRNP